ncbi:CdaR family transcriptional regulator [Bacillus sp. B-jedd]|uniref:CdaR family transcriptional regulator n=1 Tax=Bacillus sp. B-jedd TaxID=1476857 RepID=UPI00066214F0|nr:sugar diacid recognition domain-containing protein [Bacillus sp. B-jedd]
MITREIAGMLVKETSKIMNLNINVMNESGLIIATGDPSRLNTIHEGALEVVRTGLAVEITEENIEKFRGTQQGINLPIILDGRVAGVIGITGNPEILRDRGGLVKMMAELLVKQSYMASQSEWRQRTIEMIIEELLKKMPDSKNIDRWLGLLDLKLIGPYAVSLIKIGNDSFSRHMLIEKTKEILGKRNILASYADVNKLLLLFTEVSNEEQMKKLNKLYDELEKLKIDFKLAFSPVYDSLLQTRRGYQECEMALAISPPKKRMISYIEIEPEALIHQIDPELAKQFTERVLRGELKNQLDTLQAFFDANLNIKDAAAKLYIHRNTLIYRLNKIKTESGFDPQNFKDAFALQMLIWLNK